MKTLGVETIQVRVTEIKRTEPGTIHVRVTEVKRAEPQKIQVRVKTIWQASQVASSPAKSRHRKKPRFAPRLPRVAAASRGDRFANCRKEDHPSDTG
jgi:hypothetical protein